MINNTDIEFFIAVIAPKLKEYVINYRFFDEGDFGSLNQVEIDSTKLGGEIDFWSSGRISIYIWNYREEKQMLNLLLESPDVRDKSNAFNAMLKILL